MREHKFKRGDRIRVKSYGQMANIINMHGGVINSEYMIRKGYHYNFTNQMKSFCGEVFTIGSVSEYTYGSSTSFYKLMGEAYYWEDWMLEAVDGE